MRTNELPKIEYGNKIYYVDVRLQELRPADSYSMEFIPFDSKMGQEILGNDFWYIK